jgi:hypothetical protein
VRVDRPLLWVKTTDPDLVLPAYDGAQVRVLLPAGRRMMLRVPRSTTSRQEDGRA